MSENENRPIDRVYALAQWMVEHKALKSVYAFEKLCGLSNLYIRNLRATEKGNTGVDTIAKIYDAVPSVSLEWLVMGRGRMFKKKDEKEILDDIKRNIIERLMENI